MPKRRGRPPKRTAEDAFETQQPKPNDGSGGKAPFGYKHAGHLVRKNSRAIVKLTQLLEVKNSVKGREVESSPDIASVQDRIDRLRERIGRRLAKLSRWGDNPPKEKEYRNVSYLHFKSMNMKNVDIKS
jgi:hypothetical protein